MIASRLAQDQEAGCRGYSLGPAWATLQPEGASSSKILFFPHLPIQYSLFQRKGSSWPQRFSELHVSTISTSLPSGSELRWDTGWRGGKRGKCLFSPSLRRQQSQHDHNTLVLLVHVCYGTKCKCTFKSPLFTDEQTEARWCEMTCPRSHN